jgi:hypothetical protein
MTRAWLRLGALAAWLLAGHALAQAPQPEAEPAGPAEAPTATVVALDGE